MFYFGFSRNKVKNREKFSSIFFPAAVEPLVFSSISSFTKPND